jgi:transcriptional regulator with XRE-family HTH domain
MRIKYIIDLGMLIHKKNMLGDDDLNVGKKIRDIRQQKRMTQQELSQKTQIEQTVISRYETGRIVPSLTRLKQIADALEISLSDLVK